MGVHTLCVAHFRHLEAVEKFLHPLRLCLTEIGLVDVVNRERLDKGYHVKIFPLVTAHGAVLVGGYSLAVLVPHHHVPVYHRKGFLTFEDMGLEVVCLLECEEHG